MLIIIDTLQNDKVKYRFNDHQSLKDSQLFNKKEIDLLYKSINSPISNHPSLFGFQLKMEDLKPGIN